MTEYDVYRFTKKEWMIETGRALVQILFTGILFFGKPLYTCFLLPAAVYLLTERKKRKKEERLSQLRGDFKEFVTSFSASVQAGYTMERSILVGMEDLKRMYPEGGRVLLSELAWMSEQLKLQVPCDTLFANLAERAGIEEIRSFSVVLGIGKRQGGNLVQITRRTADHINKKLQVQMEMEQLIAGRMMEKNIMFVMPYFMLIYLRITNGDYMEILFSDLLGQLLMFLCLILLWGAGKWADSIIRIRI